MKRLLSPLLLAILVSALVPFAAVKAQDGARQKHVLLLGDSISIGYHPYVVEALKDEAVVIRPAGNCEGTTRGGKDLDKWLALGDGRWDVIHFNFGLHDLKRVDPTTGTPSNKPTDPQQATPEVYEKQLRQIVERLSMTGARLIFATTTPVPEGSLKPHREPADIVRYNEIAAKIMREHRVAVTDLYGYALPRLKEIQRPVNVHFKPEGSRLLAGEVARTIRVALGPAAGDAKPAARPLNFVVILVDDLGATDLECFGSRFYRTPNLNRLAAEGMRFTQAYSACTVCSPTRAAMMTGKYPARLHITDWIQGHKRPKAKLKVPDWTMHLPHEERTLAEALKTAGYATASIGKWHLGGPEYGPEKHGFDVNLGGDHRGQPPSYYSPYRIPSLPDGPAGEFLTDRESAEATRFIEQNRDRPFFLYLPHYAVHTPLMGKPDVIAKYRDRISPDDPQKNPTYAALIESVDDSVGRILRVLDERKLAERTVVIFTSDNGGLLGSTANLGLRAGKGSAYEGGVRVPLIVRWPGVTRAGSQSAEPVITVDHYPTLLDGAGVKPTPGQVIDGESLLPLLRGSNKMKRDSIYWHYPHYHPGGATPYSAVRNGDWRLVEFFEDNHVELYNLKIDPTESRDLATTEPTRADALRRQLHAWRKEVGAQLPTPNPEYAP